MNVFALHARPERPSWPRWLLAGTAVIAVHGALVALAIAWPAAVKLPGVKLPAVMIDMQPVSASPQASELDLAPGPQMQEAADSAPPPEPAPQTAALPEQIPSTPVQDNPVVAAPPEPAPRPAEEKPPEPKPELAKPKEDRPTLVKRKPKPRETRKPVEATPAPRTTAPQRAERVAAVTSAAAAGAAAAAMLPDYRARLLAHLQRYKDYPPASRAAGEQGTATLAFTVNRNGQVLSSRLARSSGSAALDAATMAMISRAQPLPAFPPEIRQASMSFSVPVRFSIR